MEIKYTYLQELFQNYLATNIQEYFERIYKETYGIQLKLAVGYCNNLSIAEEAVDSMFVSLIENKHKIINPLYLVQWMNTTTINFCNKIIGKEIKEVKNSISYECLCIDGIDNSCEIIRNNEYIKEIIYMSLERLDPAIKEIVVLRYLDGCSVNDIAAMKNVNRKTITRKINYAFEYLRKYITANYGSIENILF